MNTSERLVSVTALIDETYQKLQELQYSQGSLKKFKYSFHLFQEYASKNDVVFYTQEMAFAFLEEYCEIFSNSNKRRYSYQERKRAISKLDEMHQYNLISSKKLLSRKKYIFHGCLQASIESYITFKTKTLSPERIKSIKLYLERFSHYIESIPTVKTVNDLQIRDINSFFESCSIYTHNTRYATAISVRHYLTYLENNSLLLHTLSIAIPKIAKKRNCTFPQAFSKEIIQALLKSIEGNTSKERRDYAMILLAARLGLRSSDIINLKFENIDWEKNELSLIQQKTKRALRLPLLNDVGEAIINYIKNGRPDVQNSHIFIREAKPYTQMAQRTLFTIVDGYLKRANIKVPASHKHGPHALRHSLATLLLEENIPITTIKEILAHKSTQTTKIYLKIAEKQLLQCALDVTPVTKNRCSEVALDVY